MKNWILTSMLALGTLCVAPAMADADSAAAKSYVKDSVITAKVKSKLAAKHMDTLTNISVDTDNHGVVYLSGKAPTKDASDLAAMIAKDTEGVTEVHNKIVVAE